MKQEKYKQNMDFVHKVTNYNKYIVENVKKYLGTKVLDVGCGIGNTTYFFRKKRFIVGIDASDYYLSKFKKNVKGIKAYNIDIAKTEKLNFLIKLNFNTIFCCNVLEHIKNDQTALINMHKILPENGTLVLLVPQYKVLYGTLDKADLHYRRYEKQDLREKLRKAGFKVKKEFCINFPGIFWWYLHAKILKHGLNESSEAGLINKTVSLVKVIDKIILNSFGLSLIVIAQK